MSTTKVEALVLSLLRAAAAATGLLACARVTLPPQPQEFPLLDSAVGEAVARFFPTAVA